MAASQWKSQESGSFSVHKEVGCLCWFLVYVAIPKEYLLTPVKEYLGSSIDELLPARVRARKTMEKLFSPCPFM